LPDEQTSLSEASANATLLARADIARLAPVELLARADCSIRLDVGYDDNVVHESSSRWPLCARSVIPSICPSATLPGYPVFAGQQFDRLLVTSA
jgi:hypothetical protein